MKITIELPDAVLRQAKALAASRAMTLKQFFTEALQEHVRCCTSRTDSPWMAGFGTLSDLSDENRRILKVIEEEFETIFPEDIT